MTTTEDQRKIALHYLNEAKRNIDTQVIQNPKSYNHDPAVGFALHKLDKQIDEVLRLFGEVE